MHGRCIASRQRGIAAVEMVLVTPFLLLLLIGVAEISNAFMQYNTLVKGTQAAARYIANHATPGNTNLINLTDEEVAKATKLFVYGTLVDDAPALLDGLASATISVDPVDSVHVGVTVSYPYRPLFGGLIPGFYGSSIDSRFTLTASSVMRAL
jgi:Flp pilus assembly protein TadG